MPERNTFMRKDADAPLCNVQASRAPLTQGGRLLRDRKKTVRDILLRNSIAAAGEGRKSREEKTFSRKHGAFVIGWGRVWERRNERLLEGGELLTKREGEGRSLTDSIKKKKT